jgi:hypothetical protein
VVLAVAGFPYRPILSQDLAAFHSRVSVGFERKRECLPAH